MWERAEDVTLTTATARRFPRWNPISFKPRTLGHLRAAILARLPLLVISPYAKENYVSHVLTDQTSILRFIEDNWLGGERISTISFDRIAGSLADMFDFSRPVMRRLLLDPVTGLPARPEGSPSRLTRSIGSVVHTSVGRCWRRTPRPLVCH